MLRVGILGGGRGAGVGHLFDLHPEAVVVALCEKDPQRMQRGAALLPNLEARYADYGAFLEHDLDVVLVANEATAHVPYVIRALESGRHVLSEVLACKTLAEGVALARAVEKADALYSFGENCCTMRPVLEMKRLYRAGELGEYTYGECEYVHDCTGGWPRMTRGMSEHWRNWMPATTYCSHALGPILDITGTRPVRCVGLTTPNWLGRQVGRLGDDMGLMICQMDNGAVTKALVGLALRRRPSLHWYAVYGTRGQAENARSPGEELLRVCREQDQGAEYERSYVPTFPRDLPWARGAREHGGADGQMVADFVEAVLAGGPPPIDVYIGLDMTLPGILGYRSAYEGNVPLVVPDFRDEAVRKQYEDDHWSPYPEDAGQGQPTSPSAHGPVEIPPEVYEQQRQLYADRTG